MQEILHYLEHSSSLLAYSLLFVSAFIENIFPPIPGDTVTVVGAYLVGRGILNFWGVYLATTLGSVLGFMTIFSIAFYVEKRLIEKYQPRWITSTHIDRVESWFKKYGYGVIVLNRFLSGARSVISFVAGLSKLSPPIVLLLSFISCAIWNGILIYLGLLVGQNWEQMITALKIYNQWVLMIIILVLLVWLLMRYFRKRKTGSEL